MPYLKSEDVIVQALAARALAILGKKEVVAEIKKLTGNQAVFSLYENKQLTTVTVARVSTEALAALNNSAN
jgi:hypothetical protein